MDKHTFVNIFMRTAEKSQAGVMWVTSDDPDDDVSVWIEPSNYLLFSDLNSKMHASPYTLDDVDNISSGSENGNDYILLSMTNGDDVYLYFSLTNEQPYIRLRKELTNAILTNDKVFSEWKIDNFVVRFNDLAKKAEITEEWTAAGKGMESAPITISDDGYMIFRNKSPYTINDVKMLKKRNIDSYLEVEHYVVVTMRNGDHLYFFQKGKGSSVSITLHCPERTPLQKEHLFDYWMYCEKYGMDM